MFIEPVATCPECGGEIPLIFDIDGPRSGIRVVECPHCGLVTNMGYEITDLYEEAVNTVIENKLYLLEAAESG